ncbi:hypothetical protein J2S94_003499 [Arthrobacter bambusae]|nr:hypothetical protein [Arthrobacter bambusae]
MTTEDRTWGAVLQNAGLGSEQDGKTVVKGREG